MSSPGSGVAVALLCGPGEFGERVRDTMLALGTPVVYEAPPQAFDRRALERSQANVVVVNLDAQADADLDAVYDLLDDARYRVVFNDDDVSGGLSGWDQARWLRHLAAKILGDTDIDPPRPAGAAAVPLPVAASAADPVEVAAGLPATAAEAAVDSDVAQLIADPDPSVAVPSAASVAMALEPRDPDAPIDAPQPPAVARAWSALDDLAALEANHGAPSAEPHAIDVADLSGYDEFALDFDADAPSTPAPPPLPATPEPLAAHDLDGAGLLDMEEATRHLPPPLPAAAPVAEHDFDFDMLDFEAVAVDAAPAAFDFDHEADQHADPGTIAEPVMAATPASPAADTPSPHVALASSEWTLADVLDDAPAPPPVRVGPATFGIEKLAAEEFLAPDVDANPAHPFELSQGLSLELIPLDEAVAPTSVEAVSHESWIDPDAARPKVRRVWVLGASIGGPEAVREFLAALPRDYPALFLLAQHLGDEFVDMLAKQLAQATPLTVRTATHGARVGHGEVLIVPNGKRLLIDAQGVVVLERDTGEAAFSPSIDRVVHDAADRFGSNAGAIIFSGMTDDAVAGCRYLAAKGGLVYAQRQDTTVVSTMIDGVCDAGIVGFLGSPQELAEKLLAG